MILDLSSASRLFGQISPVVGSYEQHPIVRVMQDNATVFPLARSLEVKSPAEKLFSSTADSYSLTNPKLPIKEADLATAKKGPFVLGAAATIGSGANAGPRRRGGQFELDGQQHLSAPVGNRDLALNMMNWLTSDEDLISIRPKGTRRPAAARHRRRHARSLPDQRDLPAADRDLLGRLGLVEAEIAAG